MDYYRKNLELLKQRDEELAKKLEEVEIDSSINIIQSKCGLPTIELNKNGKKMLLHSLYDPKKEAERFISNYNFGNTALVVTLGFGLGYHIEELLKRLNNNIYLLLIEQDIKILKAALIHRDLSSILTRDKTQILVGKIEFVTLFSIIGSIYYPFYPHDNKLVFVNHPTTIHQMQEYYKNLTIQIRDVVNYLSVSLNTGIRIGFKWTRNTLLNIVECLKNQPIKKLFNKFKDKPAIIVAAGPSLDKNIHQLKLIKNNAIIIAVGTSLKPLLKNGIKPHLVVAIDADVAHYAHFAGVNDVEDIPLVCDAMIYPKILEEYNGPKFLAEVTGDPLRKWMSKYTGEYGGLSTGFSVATSAFSLARKLGCNPIILVGQDLSFKGDGQTHVSGSSYDGMKVDISDTRAVKVPGNIEKEVVTTQVFSSTIKWFEENIKEYPGLCINATEGGAKIEGTKCMPLKEAIEKYCVAKFDTDEIINIAKQKVNIKKEEINKIRQLLEEIYSELKNIEQESDKGVKLANQLLERFATKVELTQETIEMTQKLQSIIDTLKTAQATELLEAWMRTALFLLYRTQNEFKELEDKPKIIKEINRGGIFLDAINDACKEVIPLVKIALEKLDSLKKEYTTANSLDKEIPEHGKKHGFNE